MRLRRFEVKNFKSLQSCGVDWDDFLVFIGENNCGKSSFLAALSLFLSGSSIRDVSIFHRHRSDEENAVELVGHFDQLSDADLQEVAIRGRTHAGQWVLKKKYWAEHDAAEDGKVAWKEQLYTFASLESFRNWPEVDTAWGAFPDEYQPLIQQIPQRGARPSAVSREALRELVRAHRNDLIELAEPQWIPNPGGGGNWKSNANAILPRAIFVRAVHEAEDETTARDASTYGRLVNLVVERQLSQRPEMTALRTALDNVLALFRPAQDAPERKAEEIRELERRINASLGDVIGGVASIKTEPPDIRSFLLPSTSLVIRDQHIDLETQVGHQGHGLQRTLVMTLLQLLAEAQAAPHGHDANTRSSVLLMEEPELYLHPQMERLMRDVLYRLAEQDGMQVACCTHSPVFLDVAERHKAIVRLHKAGDGRVTLHQVSREIFGIGHQEDKRKLQTVARFNAAINELFFAKHVVLFEEFSAIAAVERAAELMGLFDRHKRLRREIALIDCDGKGNIAGFQRVLNEFQIPYRILHDEDVGNPTAFAENGRIAALLPAGGMCAVHMMRPTDLESVLGYQSSKGASKPFAAVTKVEELHQLGVLPREFIEAVNWAYFGLLVEPPAPPAA